MSAPFDLAVIGGGIMGCSVALFAARGGMRVVLMERDLLCRGASGVNAGTLTLQMTRASLVPYAMGGYAMWASARQWLGTDVGVTVCDGLSLAFTELEAEMLTERTTLRRDAGAPIEIVTGRRAQEIEPGLSASVRLAGYCRMDGFANSYLTGGAFRRALLDAGVTLMEQRPAQAVESGDRGYVIATYGSPVIARRIALTGGAWLEAMLAWLGIRLPIRVLVNQVAVTERLASVMRTQVGVASGLLSLKQYSHGSVVIGGGWQGARDPHGEQTSVLPDNLIGNVRLACHAIPALATARLARCWAGLEAKTTDGYPVVGPVPGHGDAYVCGCSHSGYASGPYLGKLLAGRILGREPERPLFPVERLLQDDQKRQRSLS